MRVTGARAVLQYAARNVALAVVYFASARLGMLFSVTGSSLSPWWPPSGVANAALIWGGIGFWPAILVGGVVANVWSGLPPAAAIIIAIANTLEAVSGAWLTQRIAPRLIKVERPSDFFAFLFGAALPASLLAASVGVGLLELVSFGARAEWLYALSTWAIGDWLGIVAVAPLILAWASRDLREFRNRWIEITVLLGALSVVAWVGFEGGVLSVSAGLPVRWALVPLVAWAAVRFGLRGSSASMLIVAAIATWATVRGHGPLGGLSPLNASWQLGAVLALTSSSAHAIAFLSAARERTMASLEENRQRLHGVVHSAMDAIVTLDAAGLVQAFNPAAEHLFQWHAADVIGQTVEPLIPERSRDAHRRGFERFARGAEEGRTIPHAARLFGLRRDGTEFAAEATASKFEVDGARFYTMIMRDISDRLGAERALRESEARFDSVLASMGDVVWSFSLPDSRLLYCSAAVEGVYGIRRDEMMAGMRDLLDLVHPDDRDLVRKVRRTLGVEGSARVEHRTVRPDGTVRWLRVRMSLQRDAQGNPIQLEGVTSDITRTRDLEGQLRESQKLEAIGTLAGGIAHDFNNILTAIFGNAELAMQDPALSPETHEQVSEIRRAARRARDLAQQILLFSRRRDATEARAVDLGRATADALRMIRSTVPSTVHIVATPPEGPVVVRGDVTQLHQVITNLCTNAWHAMPDGGTISVAVTSIDLGVAAADALQLVPGAYARLSVSDTGSGMSDEVRRRVFEPFYTTKPVGQGTGLGLSVVHGIIVEHGGAITVQSAPGQGTRFDVYLPVSDLPLSARVETPARSAPAVGSRILLVDDEPSVSRVVAVGLRRQGFRVQVCGNAQEALEVVTPDPSAFDAVVTDLTMPGMNGVELGTCLRALRADLCVILYSGDISSIEASARAAGIREVLEKPVSLEEMGAAIRRQLA